MVQSKEISFENPSFAKRLKGMLGVDFYRLFHTPMYYIFLAVAAIIPALVLTMTMTGGATPLYDNTWNVIAADRPLYIVSEIGEYANMNMVFIFGGIMVSVFIGHDYRSGYVKQLFTTHAKKSDYMMSKTLAGAFSMACMCVTYLFGTLFAGIISGTSFALANGFLSLLIALFGKMVMSLGWSALYTFLNVLLRRQFGVAIALSFLLGTGLPIIGAGAIFGNHASILNVFLYGSSVNACLSGNIVTFLVCLAVSAAWAVIYNIIGSWILSKRDVY